jgi:hypothetical protein
VLVTVEPICENKPVGGGEKEELTCWCRCRLEDLVERRRA